MDKVATVYDYLTPVISISRIENIYRLTYKNIFMKKISTTQSSFLISKNLTFVLLAFYLFSCSPTKHEEALLTIENVNEKKCKLSELLTSVEYIPLETNDSCLLDNFAKYIYCENHIYASTKNEIIKFNNSGAYISKLSRLGESPSDYTTINDFDIVQRDGNREIWIAHQKGISRYDAQTSIFLGLIKTDYSVLQFKYLSDNTIILCTPGEYSFYLCDMNGKLRNKFLPNDPANLTHQLVQFVTINNKVIYNIGETDDAICYNEDLDQLEIIKMVSGIDKLVTREKNRKYMEQYGYLQRSKNIRKDFNILMGYRQVNNKVLLLFFTPKGQELFIQNEEQWDKYKPESTIENDLFPNIVCRFFITMIACEYYDNDNTLMGLFRASELAGHTINGKTIDEDDNPILIKYTL